jgi:hypothetical protein
LVLFTLGPFITNLARVFEQKLRAHRIAFRGMTVTHGMLLRPFCFDDVTIHFINRVILRSAERKLLTFDGIYPSKPGVYLPQLFYQHNVFMCFVWIAEQTAIISLHSIN